MPSVSDSTDTVQVLRDRSGRWADLVLSLDAQLAEDPENFTLLELFEEAAEKLCRCERAIAVELRRQGAWR